MFRLVVVSAFASAVRAARVQVDLAEEETAAEVAAHASAEAMTTMWTCSPSAQFPSTCAHGRCGVVFSNVGSDRILYQNTQNNNIGANVGDHVGVRWCIEDAEGQPGMYTITNSQSGHRLIHSDGSVGVFTTSDLKFQHLGVDPNDVNEREIAEIWAQNRDRVVDKNAPLEHCWTITQCTEQCPEEQSWLLQTPDTGAGFEGSLVAVSGRRGRNGFGLRSVGAPLGTDGLWYFH
jgi:hypothetical protein